MINFLKRIFRKKEEQVNPPYEFGLITYTDEARLYGIFDNSTKEIRHYLGKEHIDRVFTKSLMEAMDEFGLPIHSIADEQLEIPIIKKINPEDVKYAEQD